MSDGRRTGFTEEELNILADKLAEKITHSNTCPLDAKQQDEIKNILIAKKKTIKVILWIIGILVVLALQDIYIYVRNGITWVFK